MGTTPVSAKIPDDLKEELEEADINISKAIREALEAEIRRQRRDDIKELATSLQSSIQSEEIATLIREDRPTDDVRLRYEQFNGRPSRS